MTSFIILADLGRVKAYRISRDELDPKSSLAFEDLADVDLENKHSKVSKRVTDKAGRFGYGSGSKALSESHSEQDAVEHQQLLGIAEVINNTASGQDAAIYFAAPKEILGELIDFIDAGVRKRIRVTLPFNLVKFPKLKLLERFGLR